MVKNFNFFRTVHFFHFNLINLSLLKYKITSKSNEPRKRKQTDYETKLAIVNDVPSLTTAELAVKYSLAKLDHQHYCQ